jgi:hypothetical protein
VSDEREDGWLHDYLDGRLSAAEQAAAEARLRENPELARRVEHWREISQALRESPAELAPGFYTRAGARFAASANPQRKGLRLFSWEAAGLLAATALAVALFLPPLVQRERGSPPEAPPPPAGREEVRDAPAPPPPAPLAPRPAEAAGKATVPVKVEPGASRELPARTAPAAPPALRPAEAVGRVEAAEAEQAKGAQALEAQAPLPSRVAVAPPGSAAPQEQDVSAAGLGQRAAGPGPGWPAVELPRGTVPPGQVRSIEDPEVWRHLLDGPLAPVLAPLGPPRSGSRVVLVGAREPGLDCASLDARHGPDGYVVRYRLVEPGRTGGAGGCAFVLPSDGRAVVLEPADFAGGE